MSITIIARSTENGTGKLSEQIASRVVALFESLPNRRVLIFIDDQDWCDFKSGGQAANRGFYTPVHADDNGWRAAPDRIRSAVFVDEKAMFDDFIYLHGSTAANDIALSTTLAHELQHCVQHGTSLDSWAANTLAFHVLKNLEPSEFAALGIRACDIPYERDARIMAKRITIELFGEQAVSRYIDTKEAEHVTDQDAVDWQCIRGLDASIPYDLANETSRFFPPLAKHRPTLERVLRTFRNDADFEGVNLEALLAICP